MDSRTNVDLSDEETHELHPLAHSIPNESTSNRGIWALLTPQVARARSLVGYGRSFMENLLLTEHSAQLSHGTDESNPQNNKKNF